MDANEIQNDIINSSLLKVETLEKKYEIVLKQYEVAYNNYMSALKTNETNVCSQYNLDSKNISKECYDKIWADQGCLSSVPESDNVWLKEQTLSGLVKDSFMWATNTDEKHVSGCYGKVTDYVAITEPVYPNKPIFTSLPGRSWWGTKSVTEGSVETMEECESMCAANIKCTGATFNPEKRYCWAREGDAGITPGQQDDYAIISTEKASLIALQSLNSQLIALNDEIMAEIKNASPKVEVQTEEQHKKNEELLSYYNKLLVQKKVIAENVAEVDALNSENGEDALQAEYALMSYRVWMLITVIILIICWQTMMGTSVPSVFIMSLLVCLTLLIVLTVLKFSLVSVNIFATLGLVLLSCVLLALTFSLSSIYGVVTLGVLLLGGMLMNVHRIV